MGKAGKIATTVIAGIALTGAIASVGVFLLNDAGATSIGQETVRSYQGRYYDHEGSCIFETPLTRRGDPLTYPTAGSYVMSYINYDDGSFNQFTGWDINNDNIPDILGDRMYFSFEAKAAYMKVPSLSDLEIDPDVLATLTEQIFEHLIDTGVLEDGEVPEWLMDSLINMIEYLAESGLDLSSIDVNLLQEILDKLGLSIEDLAQMFGMDLETLLNVFNAPAFEYVASDWSTPHFFRTTSKGDYKNGKWTNPNFYSKENISEGSINPLGYALDKLSSVISPVSYEFTYVKQGKTYPTPAYEIGNTQNLDSDAYALTNPTPDPTPDNEYQSKYSTYGYGFYPASSYSLLLSKMGSFSSDAIAKDEEVYRGYARDKYLKIDKGYKEYLLKFAEEHDIFLDNDTYSHVSKINEVFAKYKMQDFTMELQAYPKNEDRLKYFIENPDIGGRSGEFATATTLLYRALGVPARYVTGYFDINVNGESKRSVGGLQAHDWVEIYIDNLGWMMVDTSISSALPPEMSELLFGSPDVNMNNELGELEYIEASIEEDTIYEENVINPYEVKIEAFYSNKQSFIIDWHIPEFYNPDFYDGNAFAPTNISEVNKKNPKQALQIYVPATYLAGNYNIKVFFTDNETVKVDTVPITVIKAEIVKLEIDSGTYQDWYLPNSSPNVSGMIIRARYNDPSREPIILNYYSNLLLSPDENVFDLTTIATTEHTIYLRDNFDVSVTFTITVSNDLPIGAFLVGFEEQTASSEENPYIFLKNEFDPTEIKFVYSYGYSKRNDFYDNGTNYNTYVLSEFAPRVGGTFTSEGDFATSGIRNAFVTYTYLNVSIKCEVFIRIRDVQHTIEVKNFKHYDGLPFNNVEVFALHELHEDGTHESGSALQPYEHFEYEVSDEIDFNTFTDVGLYTASIKFRIFDDSGKIITSKFFEDSDKTEILWYNQDLTTNHEFLHFHDSDFEVDEDGWIDLGYFDFFIVPKTITIETYSAIDYGGYYVLANADNTIAYTRQQTVKPYNLIEEDYIDWDAVIFDTYSNANQKKIRNGFDLNTFKIYSARRVDGYGNPFDVTNNYQITFIFGTLTRS